MSLVDQKCIPCSGVSDVLKDEEIEKHLKGLGGWKKEGKMIVKEYDFPDFTKAMQFVNTVAGIAEQEGHHPDIHISYNKVRLELSTHAIGGLSINDFILASKVEGVEK